MCTELIKRALLMGNSRRSFKEFQILAKVLYEYPFDQSNALPSQPLSCGIFAGPA